MTSSAGSPLVGGGNDGRSRRWDEHREARRTALLGCAVEAIDASGPRLTVETAAACADVSRTIVHRYFADRDGLGDAVAEHLRDAMLEVVDRRLDDASVPVGRERVVGAVGACIEVLGRYPNRWLFMQQHRDGRYLIELYDEVAERAAQCLADGTGDTDAAHRLLAQGLVGLIDFAGRAWSASRTSPEDFAAVIGDAVRHVIDGAGAPGG